MNSILMDKKVINIIDDNSDINYVLNDNDFIIINYYNISQKNLNINIIQNSNSYLVINMASFIKDDVCINISGLIKGNNNKCVINVHSIGISNRGVFNVCVKVNENTNNNTIIEDLKGILESGKLSYMPILETDTSEVDASHFVTVGGYDEKIIFYLESKGITKDTIINMLKKAFIESLFDKEFLKLVDKGSDLIE